MQHMDVDNNLHLTFLYLKGIPLFKSLSEERIMEAVREVAQYFGPLHCQFTGVGIIKHESECLIALVDIERGAELYSGLVSKLRKNWWQFETHHDFLPHVTLRFNNAGRGLVPLDEVRSFSWNMDHLTVEIKALSEPQDAEKDIKVLESVSLTGEHK